MHEEVDWMESSDRPIVVEIAAHMGWIKPASLALNLTYSRPHIDDRCRILADYGLVESHPNATAYRIADLGRQYLLHTLEPSDLASDPLGDDSDATTLEFSEDRDSSA